MKIIAVPMPYGDSFVVEYEDRKGEKHVVVLDMGTMQSYMAVGRNILSQYDKLDLCVLSHIHDDHIGGALKYIDDVTGGLDVPCVMQWWFNANRVVNGADECDRSNKISVRHANKISRFLSIHCDEESWINSIQMGGVYELAGLTIRVLSPISAHTYGASSILEEDISTVPMAAHKDDYNTKVCEFDINAFKEDDNKNNKQSIALLIENGVKRFLWMADAHPSVVCEALRELGYNEQNPLECEYMTLSHHGSKKNTNQELMSLVKCEHYIVTGNGMNVYGLPDKETLARVIVSKGENVKIYTTQISLPLSHIFDVDSNRYKIEEKTIYYI